VIKNSSDHHDAELVIKVHVHHRPSTHDALAFRDVAWSVTESMLGCRLLELSRKRARRTLHAR
jgi:hypothetical protein